MKKPNNIVITISVALLLVLTGCFGDLSDLVNTKTPANESSKERNIIAETFLNHQQTFAEQYQIDLIEFSQQDKLATWVENILERLNNGQEQIVEIKNTGIFSDKYERTVSDGEYYYLGELKDNCPHGYGMLLEYDWYLSRYGEDMECSVVYIGQFEEGRFHGYGLRFNNPGNILESTVDGILAVEPDTASDAFLDWYRGAANYVEYEGEFEKGDQTGRGNQFLCVDDDMTDGVQYFDVEIGEYKNGKFHGDMKIYDRGCLYYSGETKKGEKSGKGTEYYLNGQICYKGEFKADEYHGEGALYDENGTLIYEGKWRYGDYD